MSKTLKREFPYPEHLQYWPYAEEQYSNTLITFERFKLWKNIIIGIIEFFEKIKYLDSCYSKQYSKLSSVLEPSESEYCGSFKNFSTISTSASKISVCYSDSSKIIGDIIIQKLNELKNGLIKKSKKYKQDFLEEFTKVSKTRSETLVSINYHQSLTMEKSKSSSLEITDPWISERALINQLEKMLKDENNYQGRMNKLFEDMGNFDQHIVNQLQNVFEEYNSSKNKECNNIKINLQNVSNEIMNMTPNKPFSYFTKKYSIASNNLWTTTRTIDNFVYKILNIHILREGVVYRQGSYFSSNWKPSWLVLTDTGYLHCFNIKNISKAIIRQYTIHKKSTGEEVFRAGQDTYKNVEKVKTSFSIQLRSPRITAVNSTYIKNNEEQYRFSIIVNTSTSDVVSKTPVSELAEVNEISTNNLSNTNVNITNNNNYNKSKKNKSNKSQIVYQIRVDTSEILEDWLTIINTKLNNNIPVNLKSLGTTLQEVCNSSNTIYCSNINIKEGHIASTSPYPAINPFINDDNNSPILNIKEDHIDSTSSYPAINPFTNNDNNSPVLIGANCNYDVYDNEEENKNTPLNGQIYPPFKSTLTLIEEVNNDNKLILKDESIIPLQNPENKSLKSSVFNKCSFDNNKDSKENDRKEEYELTPEESAVFAKNIITSDVNIGMDMNTQDIQKAMNNYITQTSDMTLYQKTC